MVWNLIFLQQWNFRKSVYFITCHQAVSLRSFLLFRSVPSVVRSSLRYGLRSVISGFRSVEKNAPSQLYTFARNSTQSLSFVRSGQCIHKPSRKMARFMSAPLSCFGGSYSAIHYAVKVRLRLIIIFFGYYGSSRQEKCLPTPYATVTALLPRSSSFVPVPVVHSGCRSSAVRHSSRKKPFYALDSITVFSFFVLLRVVLSSCTNNTNKK